MNAEVSPWHEPRALLPSTTTVSAPAGAWPSRSARPLGQTAFRTRRMGATLGSHAHREDGHGTGAEPVEGSCGADAYWPIEANDCAPVGARTPRSSNREQTPDRQRSRPDPATSARRPLVTAHAVRPQGCSEFLYWIKNRTEYERRTE